MALPAHSGTWPLLQFHNNFYTVGRTPWTSDQLVARPLPKQRTTQTQNKRIHPCLTWDWNPRSQRPSERRLFMPQTTRLQWLASSWITWHLRYQSGKREVMNSDELIVILFLFGPNILHRPAFSYSAYFQNNDRVSPINDYRGTNHAKAGRNAHFKVTSWNFSPSPLSINKSISLNFSLPEYTSFHQARLYGKL
jgi:hypothetical protein